MDKAVAAFVALADGESADDGVKYLGGAVFDLAGGVYMLSRPLAFPYGYAAYHIRSGSLHVTPSFPSTESVLSVGADSPSTKGPFGVPYTSLDVSIADVTINGSHIAATGVLVKEALYVTIGPAVLVTGYHAYGITMPRTGGSQITDSWLGEHSPHFANRSDVSAVR